MSIIDAICVNFYLNGDEGALHPEYLDANGNNIVDVADFQKVMAAIVEDSYSWSFVDITASASISEASDVFAETQSIEDRTELSFDPDDSSTSTTREYYRFRSTPTPTLSTYTLTTTRDSNSKDYSLNRYDYYTSVGPSETGIVRLVRTSGNITHNCGTGFIIDDHRIVTSGHCIYEDENGDKLATADEFLSDLQIQMCDSNGVLTNTKYDVKEIHVPKLFVTSYCFDKYDYALLTVSTTLPSSTYTHYSLGTPVNITSYGFKGTDLFISGFPGDATSLNRVNTSKGHGTNSSTSKILSYNHHTSGGFSGSPVYVATKYKIGSDPWVNIYTAIAVNQRGNTNSGSGPLIDDNALTFFKQDSTNVGY
ncbi:MAG: serine protease [Oscillospiraceae bacterium]|nr:serine protease [Oscillospiraceae bacterium]